MPRGLLIRLVELFLNVVASFGTVAGGFVMVKLGSEKVKGWVLCCAGFASIFVKIHC